MNTILRWILFIPSAILASSAAGYIVKLVHSFVTGWRATVLSETYGYAVANFVSGVVLVWVIGVMAPTHKRVSAAVVSGLYCACILWLVYGYCMSAYYLKAFELGATAVGLAVGLSSFQRELVRISRQAAAISPPAA